MTESWECNTLVPQSECWKSCQKKKKKKTWSLSSSARMWRDSAGGRAWKCLQLSARNPTEGPGILSPIHLLELIWWEGTRPTGKLLGDRENGPPWAFLPRVIQRGLVICAPSDGKRPGLESADWNANISFSIISGYFDSLGFCFFTCKIKDLD